MSVLCAQSLVIWCLDLPYEKHLQRSVLVPWGGSISWYHSRGGPRCNISTVPKFSGDARGAVMCSCFSPQISTDASLDLPNVVQFTCIPPVPLFKLRPWTTPWPWSQINDFVSYPDFWLFMPLDYIFSCVILDVFNLYHIYHLCLYFIAISSYLISILWFLIISSIF